MSDDRIADDMRHIFLRTPEGERVLAHLRETFYDVQLMDTTLEGLATRVGKHSVVRYILDTIEDGE